LCFQTYALKAMFHLSSHNIDIPGSPLFALFSLGTGMTSIIPDMNPARPAAVDPKKIVQNILHNQVSFVAGSPAIWEKVGEYCLKNRVNLGSVRCLVMFGAPVRLEIHEMFQKILTAGDTYTPYGATECLPVSLISGKEILKKFKSLTLSGKGICIGKAAPETEIKIIAASDIPVRDFQELESGHIGEILVRGPQVTKAYFEMPQETELAKIPSDKGLWHRMGDVGYQDSEGLLWFLGRKGHVVKTPSQNFYPLGVEVFFNKLPGIKKSALIKYDEAPAVVLEPDRDWKGVLHLNAELPKEIKTIFMTPKLPVDVRHNIKIDRSLLSRLAESKSRKLQVLFRRS